MLKTNKLIDTVTGQYSGKTLEISLLCYHLPLTGRASQLAQRKTVDYEGRKVEAEVLEFEAKNEGWNQYNLEDGTLLKTKLVLLEIARLIGEYDAKGEPVYLFTAQQIVGATTPDSLKKKA